MDISEKKNTKIRSAVSWVIFVLAILLFAYLLFCRVTGRLPDFFGYSVINIITDSMDDAIPPNTYILIKKTDAYDIEKGDIITFRSTDPRIEGKFNTHRVFAVSENGDGLEFVTMGDNNLAPDDYTVTPDRLVGKYIRTLHVLTAVLMFFTNKYVIFGLVLLTLILGVVRFAITHRKTTESE